MNRLFADLPEDEDATGTHIILYTYSLYICIYIYKIILLLFINCYCLDMVMETVAGIEMYSLLKKSDNIELQRKILIAKWLYIQGFLNNIFPPTERFIPYHLLDEIED